MKIWKQRKLTKNQKIIDGKLYESEGETVEELVGETLKIPEQGIEITKVIQKDVAFQDLEIPEDWKLLNYDQAIKIVNNKQYYKWLNFESQKDDFYIEQPFERNKRKWCAWLGCGDSSFNLSAYGDLDYNIAARGVILCGRLK